LARSTAQRRLTTVSTALRRQAQGISTSRSRSAMRLYDYAMSDDERSLYDDVTEYSSSRRSWRSRGGSGGSC